MSHPDQHDLEAPPGYGPPAADDEPELRELLRRLWGYKWLIATVIVLVVGTTWLVVEQMVPRYTATSVLLIEPPERHITDIRNVVEGLDTHPQTIRSEVLVLQSRELVAEAAERLGLYETRRFTKARNRGSLFSHLNPLSYLPQEWKRTAGEFWRDAKASVLGGGEDGVETLTQALPTDPEAQRRNAIVNRLLAGLSVSREEFTRVIRISFTFEDAKLAAEAANALADAYVQNTLDVKYAGTREAADWLNKQLEELRGRVAESEAAVERVRQGEALVQGRSAKLVSEQISALNRQLLDANAETERLRSRLRQIEELRNTPNWTEQSSTLLGSDMIQTLRLEKFKLERQEADLALELGDKHPKIINIRAEIADISRKLERELEKIIAAARSELEAAQAHENALKKNLEAMTNQVGDLNESEMRLRALEREAAANRSLYEAFLTRYKETSVQQDVQQPDARVISYAEMPTVPSYPPKDRYINTAIVLALGLALGLVFVLEKLDKGFRTSRQAERQTGLPVLGMVPQVKLGREGVKHPEDLIAKDSHTRFSESINILYSHLKWPRDGGPKKVVLVTSAMPKEGKTSVASSLARRAAYLGDRALLIDGDFRHPHATSQLGLRRSPGIADLLANGAKPDETLQRDEASGAYVLSCGNAKEDPVALIGSEAFRRMLESLKEAFDLIVVDSSPTLAVAEPQILARSADQTLVLVRWGKTPRQAGLTAIKQLQEVGARLVGLALTQVDLAQQSYYGYGEYGYYVGKMKGYYSE